MTVRLGLADTSIFIASELGRELDESRLPAELAISAISLAELEVGVHAAKDTETRALRMATLNAASTLAALPVDEAAAREWARMRYRLAESKRRINVNDLWIASIAVANGLPVVTQDSDFEALAGLGGPDVILL